jgi:hypothetical protein
MIFLAMSSHQFTTSGSRLIELGHRKYLLPSEVELLMAHARKNSGSFQWGVGKG